MNKLLTRSVALGALATVLLTGCSSSESDTTIQPKTRATYTDGTIGTVQEVKTGNTISVKLGDQVKDVRMLNVVAPTKNNVETSGDCLVDESTKFLVEKLPAGTEVTLNFDPTQTGTSGYIDAAVYVGDDFINKDVVAAGMAATTYSTANDKFYAEISGAQQQAANDKVGLYSPDTECSIAHQIQQQIDAVHAADSNPNADEKKAEYQKISQFYNRLKKDGESAVTWTGSIMTLDATKAKMEELQTALGANYYNEDGQTEAEAQASASATGRPDGATSAPAPADSAAPAEGGNG